MLFNAFDAALDSAEEGVCFPSKHKRNPRQTQLDVLMSVVLKQIKHCPVYMPASLRVSPCRGVLSSLMTWGAKSERRPTTRVSSQSNSKPMNPKEAQELCDGNAVKDNERENGTLAKYESLYLRYYQ
jgi:hypothetical protein